MEKKAGVKVFHYNANRNDKELDFDQIDIETLGDEQLLWVNVLRRDEELLARVAEKLKIRELKNEFLRKVTDVNERPKLDKFEEFYRFFIVSVRMGNDQKIIQRPIDFLVGKNYVVTVSDGEVEYFAEFREREIGETRIGELDAESFVASLLDLHLVSYFKVLEKIEAEVDELDEEILKDRTDDKKILPRIVKLRGEVSKLRRLFLPHRDVFYALSRPDFFSASQSDSIEYFKSLDEHFENAVDAIESSRDTVISLFDLYSTKTGDKTNKMMQRLTFITLLVGSLSVFAGVMGMNFKLEFFESNSGFWIVVGFMIFSAAVLVAIASWRRWI